MGNNSKQFYGINDNFWTGGYIDVTSGNIFEIKWHGSPNTPFSNCDAFVSFHTAHLDEAIDNLSKNIDGIGKYILRDCGNSPD